MTVFAETCDFSRFGDAGSYMGFTGLTPFGHSSGASGHQDSITKTGNRHVRRVATPHELSGFVWGLMTGNVGPVR